MNTNTAGTETRYGIAPRLLLASLSLAAGGVHLAMVPIHAQSSTTEAIGFAGVGWAQVILGIALMLRPSREILGGAMLLNVAVIAMYVVSRTAGLPVTDPAWDPETVSGIDMMTTIFEAVIVAGAGLLLLRPGFGATRAESSGFSFETAAVASAIPLIVLVITSAALADPDLVRHSHGASNSALVSSTSGGHGHAGTNIDSATLVSLAENRCDLGFNPAAYWKETALAGIDTLMGGQATVSDHNASASVVGSAELDKLIAQQMTSEGEIGDAMMVLSLAKVSDDVYEDWLRWLGASGIASHAHMENPLAPDDNRGMGGHLGPQAWHAMTDQAQCDALAADLELARQTALKYPTVADAEAAGWRRVTGYVPGIAAHYMNFRLVDGEFNIEEPEMLLYDGIEPNSNVVGLSYYVRHAGTAEPTQGFVGNNDHFHRHDGLCVSDAGVIGDSTTTEEECAAMGGRKADGSSGWMNHVWVVPGCESPWGMFSGANPILDGELGQKSGEDGGGCAGSGVRDRYDLSAGEVGNTPTVVGGSVELVVGN